MIQHTVDALADDPLLSNRKSSELTLGSDLFAFSEFASRGGSRFDLLLDSEGDERFDGGASAVAFRIAKEAPWVPVRRLSEPRGGKLVGGIHVYPLQTELRPVACISFKLLITVSEFLMNW